MYSKKDQILDTLKAIETQSTTTNLDVGGIVATNRNLIRSMDTHHESIVDTVNQHYDNYVGVLAKEKALQYALQFIKDTGDHFYYDSVTDIAEHFEKYLTGRFDTCIKGDD